MREQPGLVSKFVKYPTSDALLFGDLLTHEFGEGAT